MKPKHKSINTLYRGVACSCLLALLSVGLVLSSNPAEAQPFAYVTSGNSNTVSVIDIGSNTVAATVPVGSGPVGVAITPDGTRAYVGNAGSNTVSVIDTGTNTVVDTVPVGSVPQGVAITPDGTRTYVANLGSNTVSVIDTGTNTVVDTVPVGGNPSLIAITPDGTRAYVVNQSSGIVSVIDTGTNTVVATVTVGTFPVWVAITPDGTRAYVANFNSGTVSVIDTGTNTVVATVTVGGNPLGVAITPLTNVVFDAFTADAEIEDDEFEVEGSFTLGAASDGIDLLTEDVILSVGTFTTTIPAGSFEGEDGEFELEGDIDGVELEFEIESLGGNSFDFEVEGEGADLTGTVNPVEVALTIGDDAGTTSVIAEIDGEEEGDDDDDGDDDDGDDDDGDDDDGDDDDDGGASKPVVGLPLPSVIGANGYTPDSHSYSWGVPNAFSLSQNVPNPFNPSTTIRFTLAEASHVRLVIYNVLGQVVRTLVNAEKGAGVYNVSWDGRDESGNTLSSGLYLYRLEAGPNVAVQKMMFAK